MRERYRNPISIFTDFGGSEESVVRHLQKYAMLGLAKKLNSLKNLKNFKGKVSYDYDWRINGTESPG